jgi:hypothetical protein
MRTIVRMIFFFFFFFFPVVLALPPCDEIFCDVVSARFHNVLVVGKAAEGPKATGHDADQQVRVESVAEPNSVIRFQSTWQKISQLEFLPNKIQSGVRVNGSVDAVLGELLDDLDKPFVRVRLARSKEKDLGGDRFFERLTRPPARHHDSPCFFFFFFFLTTTCSIWKRQIKVVNNTEKIASRFGLQGQDFALFRGKLFLAFDGLRNDDARNVAAPHYSNSTITKKKKKKKKNP